MTTRHPILDWARAQLPAPVRVTEVKDRPWATVWRPISPDGISFGKAAGPASHYEVPLLSALHRSSPELVPTVLAAKPEAGWLLLADAGSTPAEQLAEFDGPVWERMLARFARLQRLAAPLAEELIAAGVTRCRRICGICCERLELHRAEA